MVKSELRYKTCGFFFSFFVSVYIFSSSLFPIPRFDVCGSFLFWLMGNFRMAVQLCYMLGLHRLRSIA